MDKLNENSKLIKEEKTEEQPEKVPYPKAVFFIIGNEFCERFSYYGMKAILTLFLVNIIQYKDSTATTVYHVFSMFAYFTPVFGAMLADSLLGKFKTIFYISILYAAGNIILSIAAIPRFLPMEPFAMLGLAMIATGTGGIKPCVAAFGGDQFAPTQERQLQQFFSFFYMAINCGSLLSTVLTPVLREDVSCFNERTCYSLAFGVPAILMVVALIFFLLGRPLYKIIAPTGNVVIKVFQVICNALSRRGKGKKANKEHWLDYADEKYEKKFISDVKDVLHVLFLYLPLPVFWALFDQQGSRWTLQAAAMDGQIFPTIRIKPDQMQMINPLLIILFIPLFEYCVYPLLEKCHFLVRPVQRIAVGGVLAAFSFIIAGFAEMAIEKTLPVLPAKGFSQVTIINTLPCNITIGSQLTNTSILFNEMEVLKNVRTDENHTLSITAENCHQLKDKVLSYNLLTDNEDPVKVLMVIASNKNLDILEVIDDLQKPKKGESKVRILFTVLPISPTNTTISFNLTTVGTERELNLSTPIVNVTDFDSLKGFTKYDQVFPEKYRLKIMGWNRTIHLNDTVELKMGANYILTVIPISKYTFMLKKHVIVKPNSISMLYQIPQYVVITAGEIMFSITGLEFSYSQAPKSMKSVLQAAWLLTVAFGNLIVVIVAQARLFSKQSHEFFMFACLMVVDMIIFAIMGYFYKYVQKESNGQEMKQPAPEKTETGITNPVFLEDSTHM